MVLINRTLCDRLHKEAGVRKKDIPELPKRHIIGNFSQKTIGERAERLNMFLSAAVKAEHLQWGIRVDDAAVVVASAIDERNKLFFVARLSEIFRMKEKTEFVVAVVVFFPIA